MTTRWAVAIRLTGHSDRTDHADHAIRPDQADQAANQTAGRAPAMPWNSGVVTDLIWAQALPTDGLDHARATHDPPDDAEILLLLRATSDTQALCAASQLYIRAQCGPVLRGWTIRSLDVLPLADLLGAPNAQDLPH
jgi:hypothetical protein